MLALRIGVGGHHQVDHIHVAFEFGREVCRLAHLLQIFEQLCGALLLLGGGLLRPFDGFVQVLLCALAYAAAHRTVVLGISKALFGGLFIPVKRPDFVLVHAGAPGITIPAVELGRLQPLLGGLEEPAKGRGRVFFGAAAHFAGHAAVELRHGIPLFGGLLVPVEALGRVGVGAHALPVHIGAFPLAVPAALSGGLLIPGKRPGRVLGGALAVPVHVAAFLLGPGMARLGGLAHPFQRPSGVLLHPLADAQPHGQVELCLGFAALSGPAVPLGRLCLVLGGALAGGVHHAAVKGGGGAAQLGGLAVQVQLLLVVAGLARRNPLFKQAFPLLPAGLFGGFGFGLGPGGVPLLFQRRHQRPDLRRGQLGGPGQQLFGGVGAQRFPGGAQPQRPLHAVQHPRLAGDPVMQECLRRVLAGAQALLPHPAQGGLGRREVALAAGPDRRHRLEQRESLVPVAGAAGGHALVVFVQRGGFRVGRLRGRGGGCRRPRRGGRLFGRRRGGGLRGRGRRLFGGLRGGLHSRLRRGRGGRLRPQQHPEQRQHGVLIDLAQIEPLAAAVGVDGLVEIQLLVGFQPHQPVQRQPLAAPFFEQEVKTVVVDCRGGNQEPGLAAAQDGGVVQGHRLPRRAAAGKPGQGVGQHLGLDAFHRPVSGAGLVGRPDGLFQLLLVHTRSPLLFSDWRLALPGCA